MLAIVGGLLFSGTIFYMVYTLKRAAELSEAEGRIGVDWGSAENKIKAPFYVTLTRPLLDGPYQDLASGFWKKLSLENWKKRLISAGLRKNITAEQFVAAKFWLTLMVGLFLFLIYVFAEEPPPPWMGLGIILLMFFYPNLHVRQLRDSRQREIRISMPYVVDLLCLSMEAGLDFMGAIGKVVERAPKGPLIEEMELVMKDIQLGQTRAMAMRAMAERVDMMEMSSFVATIVSSDQMGASIGTVLRAQSDTMRSDRLVRAEKAGAQASQKMLIPLVFFILPAVMLMIFGPIILSMIGVK